MKKVLCFIIIMLLMSVQVSADVIWEPYDDDFYDEHRDELEYEDRVYTIKKSTEFFNEPNGKVQKTLDTDEKYTVSYIYTDVDGKKFGMINDYKNDKGLWFEMDNATRIYDGDAFYDEHVTDFLEYDGRFDSTVITGINFYEYPCSDEIVYTTTEQDESYLQSNLNFYNMYLDADNRMWGQVGYFLGHRGCWVCLDDPTLIIKKTETPIDDPINEVGIQNNNNDKETPEWVMTVGIAAIVVLCAASAYFMIIKKYKDR